ncbi:MAG: hypothetical protein KY450_02855, partial [Actinobacteria bacterium]|nr:hypothetical protein [Actinomycetota bacterium]
INGSNPILLGALADAAIQLGRYEEAFTATQRMVDVRPDTSSLARVSYTWELRGETALARRYMERALEVSPSAAASAFAHHHLGELAFDSGDAAAALRHHDRAVDADPRYRAALQGRAKAHAALDGRDYVLPDDVVALAAPVLTHRLVVDLDRELRGATAAGALGEILERVPVGVGAGVH